MTAERKSAARVLVPLDDTPRALRAIPYAAVLAGGNGEIVLVQVLLEPQPVRGLLGNVTVPAAEVLRRNREESQCNLDAIAEQARRIAPDVAVGSVVAVGDAAEEIVRLGRERAVDLIVLASEGRGPLGCLTYGSVADRVTREATAPVAVVRAHDGPEELDRVELRRLIVPLDGSPLAAQALPVAKRLAQRLEVPVLLLSVVDPHHLLADPVVGAVHPAADAELMLEQAGRSFASSGVTVTREVLTGPAADRITEAARPGDVIVLTSRGRSGVKRWLVGSVAEQLVRHAPVPVIVVHQAAAGELPA